MTEPTEVERTARHILDIMVTEQRLHPGNGMSPLTLQRDLTRHEIPLEVQQSALEFALQRGWLQKGPYGEWQLTETGFAVD